MPVSNEELSQAITQTWRGGGEIELQTKSRGLMLQYWKKCERQFCNRHREDKGWITIGPSLSDPLRHAQYLNEKHMTPLPQYGTQPPGPSSSMLQRGLGYELIVSNGGLKEFPVEQVQALGWDMIPAVREARPEVALNRSWCDQCYGRSFVSPESLAAHMSVMHKEVAPARAIGAEVKGAVEAVTKATDPTAMVTAIMQALPYVMQAMQNGTLPPLPVNEVAQAMPYAQPVIPTEDNVAEAVDFSDEFRDVNAARRARRGG